jgi:hypothetical protein
MNIEIGAEVALFPEKEYILGIFVAVYFECEGYSVWLSAMAHAWPI